MANIHLESCVLNNLTDLAKRYAGAFGASWASYQATGNPRGGPCFRMAGGFMCKILNQNYSTPLIMGVRFKTNSLGNAMMLAFAEGGTIHTSVGVDGNGAVRAWRNNASGTVLGISDNNTVQVGVWHYLEAKVFVHDTLGTVEVRVDNEVVLNLTGQDTRNAATGVVSQLWWTGISSSQHDICDFYANDTIGGGSPSLNADFWGDTRVDGSVVDAAGNYSQFASVGGGSPSPANYLQVDDGGNPDDDTTYNEAEAVGSKDSYQHASFPALITEDIKALQAVYFVKKSDAGAKSMKVGVRTNSTDDLDAGSALPTDYEHRLRNFDVNPVTGLPWTKSEIDAVETLVEVGA